jgi:glycosyltransferase involved in cell wall biosynthesis
MRVNLHMYPTTFTNESRMLRITGSLIKAAMFDHIHILAMWDSGLAEKETLDAGRTVWRVRTPLFGSGGGVLRKVCRFIEWTIRCLWLFRGKKVECVNPHSLSMLPLAMAFRLLKRCKVVYDTHEFEPETIECRGLRQVFAKFIERCSMPFIDSIVVTSDGFGRLYEERYGVDNVVVVKNYPLRYQNPERSSPGIKQQLGIPANELVFVYQGLMAYGRAVELLLRVFARSHPTKHLVLLGFGPLVPLVQDFAGRSQNIHFLPGVAPLEVVRRVSTADVGFCLIERTCLSYYHTLPNKMLESLQGGVPVIVSDFPDMGGLVAQHGCGWKIPVDEAELFELVNRLTPAEISEKKEFARAWARENHWEREAVRYLAMMDQLLDRETLSIYSANHHTSNRVSTDQRISA